MSYKISNGKMGVGRRRRRSIETNKCTNIMRVIDVVEGEHGFSTYSRVYTLTTDL